MLGRSSYPSAQISAARAEFAALAAAWRAVAARSEETARVNAEVLVFNQMVVALDGWFMHRLRGVEGKNGNAMNEVRLLAEGVTTHGCKFPQDSAIKWKPDASVTGYQAGDTIALSEEVFTRLAGAYLDGIAKAFAE